MTPLGELAIAAAVGGAGLVGAKLIHRWLDADARRRRRARKTPLSPIADAASGAIRIAGEVAGGDKMLRLPFSAVEGVAHHTRLMVWGAELRWIGSTGAQPFFVDDTTGRALVLVERGSQIDFLGPELADEPIGLDSADVQAIIARRDESWIDSARNLTYTFRQIRIAPGDRIELFGVASREPPQSPSPRDHAGTYREPPTQLVIRPLDGKVTIKRK